MGVYLTEYEGAVTSGISPAVWNPLQIDVLRSNPSYGYVFFDDFLNFSRTVESYQSVLSSGASLNQISTEVGGVIQAQTSTTQDNAVALQTGAGTGVQVVIKNGGQPVGFEARIRLAQVADAGFGIGLAQQNVGGTATGLLNTAANNAEIQDIDFVGFRVALDDPDALDAVYRVNGSALKVVKDIAQAVTANTWYKLGVRFDPADKLVRWFVDGVEVANALVTAADFPENENLAPVFALKAGSTTNVKADVDWWQVAAKRA